MICEMEGQLTSTFHCGKKQFNLILNDTRLEWQEHDNRKKQNVSVPLDEVIAVNVTTSPKSDNRADLKINYVQHKKSSFVLKCTAIIFSAEISVCEEWVQAIKRKQKSGFSQPRKLLVFINPISGNSKSEKIYKSEAAPLFALAGVETVAIVTEKAHHCTEVLLTYNLSDIDGVVVCGGDGIYSECVNGLVGRVQKEAGVDEKNPEAIFKSVTVPIGLIPAGTGNGIAYSCCGCLSVETSVLSIIMGRCQPSNISSVFSAGEFLTHSALLVAVGFFSDAVYFTEQNRQYGKMRYLWLIVKSFASFRPFEAEVSYLVEDKTTTPIDSLSDIPIHVEGKEETFKWVTVKGTYINLVATVRAIREPVGSENASVSDDSKTRKPNSLQLILQGMCSRLQMLKFLVRLKDMTPDVLDFDFVKAIDSKAYKVKLLNQPPESSPDADKRKCLDMDGDIFKFNGSDFEIRVHVDLVSLFTPLVPPPE